MSFILPVNRLVVPLRGLSTSISRFVKRPGIGVC